MKFKTEKDLRGHYAKRGTPEFEKFMDLCEKWGIRWGFRSMPREAMSGDYVIYWGGTFMTLTSHDDESYCSSKYTLITMQDFEEETMTEIEQLRSELSGISKRLAEFAESKSNEFEYLKRVDRNKKFFSVDRHAGVLETRDCRLGIDNKDFSSGNYFTKREHAELAEALGITPRSPVERLIIECYAETDPDWRADWSDGECEKYEVSYHYGSKDWYYYHFTVVRSQGAICVSEKTADTLIPLLNEHFPNGF